MDFEGIYIEYQRLVFNLALQYVQNIEDAEEITQDVFLKVYKHLSTFKQQSSLKTWIYRITINQSLDFIKSKSNKTRRFFTALFTDHESTLPAEAVNFNHPGIALENKEAIETIFRAINQLADKQKTVIILLKIEHKSQAEAAEIMQLNVKALESLFQRAKKNLEINLNTKGNL